MLETNGGNLPHQWITGDDEMGRSSRFRRDLRVLDEQYLLDVPSNTNIRDIKVEPPAYSGRCRFPKKHLKRVDKWRDSLDKGAWTRSNGSDGKMGTLVLEIVKRRVWARNERS
jgi:hypothetical protein